MGRILVPPSIDVDSRLFSNPKDYAQMQNGCGKFGRNGYMSCADGEDIDLHVKSCTNKRCKSQIVVTNNYFGLVVTRRKRGSFKTRRDGQFEDEEKYFQFNYTSADLADMSTPLLPTNQVTSKPVKSNTRS